ncbi:MAG TPA: hypothetical protein VIR98_00015 [Candidatus Paceibacterota bacterium]|jgi:hypothetical protein
MIHKILIRNGGKPELFEGTMYRDIMCKHEVETPRDKQIGYMLRPSPDCEFIFDAKDMVWKPQRSSVLLSSG